MHIKSSSSSMKLKTLIQNLLSHPLYRFLRALSKAKTIFLEISKHNNKKRKLMMFFQTNTSKNQHKIFFGSFRLHYNWCSSHVVPVPQPFHFPTSYINGEEEDDGDDSQLSSYLEGLEHKKLDDVEEIRDVSADYDDDHDINHLADMFIANCHEKFLLEKVESYRMFQEMLERSL